MNRPEKSELVRIASGFLVALLGTSVAEEEHLKKDNRYLSTLVEIENDGNNILDNSVGFR